ncbi:hypothetical protein FRB94_003797 [Tulasnella sp. JGI-2019a]|nr:hypothetical protein FRB93_005010 [Tulasnella sp. JGI-2019a]KAG9002534.1 hypothetical protein FRB94_003797 [Tulasnella sp. JGI-2019a]
MRVGSLITTVGLVVFVVTPTICAPTPMVPPPYAAHVNNLIEEARDSRRRFIWLSNLHDDDIQDAIADENHTETQLQLLHAKNDALWLAMSGLLNRGDPRIANRTDVVQAKRLLKLLDLRGDPQATEALNRIGRDGTDRTDRPDH